MSTFLGIAWENLIIGLLGGFAVSGLFYANRRVREWLIQRRFPIAGHYISKFEDEADGVDYIATAPAEIRQRGRRISGTTSMGNRGWELQGEISPSGYIHGVYVAEDPVDRGIGNFFLRIYPDRRLEGLWSGYDSANDSITAGRYTFTPLRSNVEMRPARSTDMLAILRIADDQLGDGYVNEDLAAKFSDSDDGFAYVAESGGKVVGFAMCLVQTADDARKTMRLAAPRHLRFAGRVGLLKTVAVALDHHGRGIGTQLTRACLDEFTRRGVPAVYSLAWRSSDRVNIQGVLARQGFSPVGEVESYWAEDSLREGYRCPACGDPPCACAAVVYSQVL